MRLIQNLDKEKKSVTGNPSSSVIPEISNQESLHPCHSETCYSEEQNSLRTEDRTGEWEKRKNIKKWDPHTLGLRGLNMIAFFIYHCIYRIAKKVLFSCPTN